jgi:hypothetical protein
VKVDSWRAQSRFPLRTGRISYNPGPGMEGFRHRQFRINHLAAERPTMEAPETD